MSQQRKLSIVTILASIMSISAVAGSLGSLQAQEGETFSTIGRIIAAILSFIGLAIILGFISNVGTSFIVSKLNKSNKKQLEETKELVKNKINTLEQLH